MKKLLLIILTAAAVMGAGPRALAAGDAPSSRLIAYYFHGNFRCYTCNMMEQYSKEAIETYFKDDIDAGKIAFLSINVDEKKNKHFIQDYQLYTKSLILSLVKDGKEIKSKNLEKIWQYARNKQQFSEYVVLEIEAFRGDDL